MPIEHETPTTSAIDTLADLVGREGPVAFVDVLDLAADLSDELADRHERGEAHGRVGPAACVRRRGEAWLLAPPAVVPDVAPARAPELPPGSEPTPAADVFALGATLLYALTGEDLAGDGPAATTGGEEPLSDSLPEVMARFLGSVRACLAADPASRPTALEVLATVEGIRGGPPRPRVLPPPPAVAAAAAVAGFGPGADAASPPVPEGATPVVIGGAAAGAALAGGVTAAGVGDAGAAGSPTTGAPPVPVGEGAGGDAPSEAAAGGGMEGEGTAGEGADGALVGTAAGAGPRKRRGVALLVAASVVAVFVLGLNLGKRDNEPKGDLLATAGAPGTSLVVVTVEAPTTVTEIFGPPPAPVTALSTTTTASTTTTTMATTTTTEPTTTTTTLPTTTTRPGQPTIFMAVDMAQNATCPFCAANVRSDARLMSPIIATAPHGSLLQAWCWAEGDLASDGNFSSTQWIHIVGPTVEGWVPITVMGRNTSSLPQCPAPPTTTTTSTAPAP